MRKLLAIFALLFPAFAYGQYTQVSAHVIDSNGGVYQNCSLNAVFVGQSSNPGPYLISGSVFSQSIDGAKCDSSGNITVRAATNSAVSPTPSQWQFNFCDQTGKYCGQTLITILGSTQDISSALTAVAPILPSTGGGGLGVIFPLAGAGPPSPVGTSSCPSGTVPSGWTQNAAGTYQTQFGSYPALSSTSDSTFPGGLVSCRAILFYAGDVPNVSNFANAQAFSVVGLFSASPDKHFLTQYEYTNDPSDSATYNTGNLGIAYGEVEVRGTPNFNTTFMSSLRFRMDDKRTGGSKPRVWSVYQAETNKTAAHDITNCSTSLNGFNNQACYSLFYGESGATLSGTEDETGAVYDVFSGGTKDIGGHATNGTGNVFRALVQSSTGDRFTFSNGFTSEDFGSAAGYYDMLLKGVNASGTPSGYAAAVGPFFFGSQAHPPSGVQVEISGGALRIDNLSASLSVCTDSSKNLTTSGCSGGGVTGSGTLNFIPKWSSSTALADSTLAEAVSGTLTSTSSSFNITSSANGGSARLKGGTATATTGGSVSLIASDGDGSGNAGGAITISAGNGASTGAGGDVSITAGQSASVSTGAAGNVRIDATAGTSGANILFGPGYGGSGTPCTGCKIGAVMFDGCQSSSCNTDNYGSLSVSAATTVSYTFTQTYGAHPNCILTPAFDLNGTRMWITYTAATSFTVNFSAASTGSISYHCWGHV